MTPVGVKISKVWMRLGTRFLPFADAATAELPLGRLLRLALFQVSVGMATVLLVGTLNRVMIVELGVSATVVALMVSLPIFFAPLRAIVGFKSDHHRSALGWKRVPFILMGTMFQFGGLAILPFALLIMSGDTTGPTWIGQVAAALAFFLVGAGLQTTQTAGLALATDLAPESARPRVVALMYVMLLVGMAVSGTIYGLMLANFTEIKLIQAVQGSAVVTVILNFAAAWKQEPRNPSRTRLDALQPDFGVTFRAFLARTQAGRFLLAVGLGTLAFNMQDIVLEPYGGEILGLSVGHTSALTALLAIGALTAFGLAAHILTRGSDPCRLAAWGLVAGLPAFAAVSLSAPLESPLLFRAGTLLIGFGGGLFSVGTLAYAMALEPRDRNGLALGAWGAVQALAIGMGVAAGGVLRDVFSALGEAGVFGPVLVTPATGYCVVYVLEMVFLLATLVVIGPLVRFVRHGQSGQTSSFGLTELSN